jgi:hypothetical protein
VLLLHVFEGSQVPAQQSESAWHGPPSATQAFGGAQVPVGSQKPLQHSASPLQLALISEQFVAG